MNNITHPVEKEELMAYLDRELPAERAAVVGVHLEQCAECRVLAADLRLVSEKLATWQVEPSPARLAERVTAAANETAHEAATRRDRQGILDVLKPRRPLVPHWVWGLAGVAVVFLFIAAISIPNLLRSRIAADRAAEYARQRQLHLATSDRTAPSSGVATEELPLGVRGGMELKEARSPEQPAEPMIVRTASLALVAKDFDQARTAVETIVRRHQGYSAQLTVTGQADAGRTLAATFRVPANQLDAALGELKSVGRVEQESQGGEEVTQQYVDLRARLSNARNTEQRLIEVLRQRTGRVADILAVEQEIARVRGEIERMDAQLKNLENQVRFASLQVRLSEEYKAPFGVPATSTGTRLRNAMVEGYHSLVESAVGLVEFLLSYGPVLLFWGLILFFPARFAWRRLHALRHK